MKINYSNKLVCNLYAKKVCYSHKKLKTNIKSWISFENYMNIKFRKKQQKKKKIDFEKDFGKTMENARKHRDIKVVTTNKRKNYLVSEPTYHTTKWFLEDLIGIEMKKIKVKMNKPIYLDLSILEIAKH